MVAMLFARPDGQWFDFPPLDLAAMHGERLVLPTKRELIPLPEGAALTLMPEATPVGFDRESGEFLQLDENPYKQKKSEPAYAVAALLPQGYTRLLLPACLPGRAKLPILGYTAVGVEKGRLLAAAAPTDEHELWHPRHFNTPELSELVKQRQLEFPGNRVIQQLSRCALEYGCFTAQNIFYRRWEGGMPASPACNASCLACLSQQPDQCSPQQRIDFCPEAEEIAAVAAPHLEQAEQAMISFGQGCEGEPSLAYPMIVKALRLIRRRTGQGKININTNAGHTAAIQALLEAGLDSLRVSLFSPFPEEYATYHQPRDYQFPDVLASLRLAQRAKRPVALNLLAYPGFTDTEPRLAALVRLAREYGLRQIQLRNLNCDPRLMAPFCREEGGLGMLRFIAELGRELPEVEIGSYSHI